MNKLELLAPAGDLEKLKIAVEYGADAVYFGAKLFSLRQGAGNFSIPEIIEGVEFAHAHNVKCYLTLNIYAHNEDIQPLKDFLKEIKDIPIDAFLVADPGIMALLRENIPNACIHLSTQSNLTNYYAAKFWQSQGVSRLVMARELSVSEIRTIRENIPEEMEIEAFVHGAMCISYSGRCLLSTFMTGRDSNRGACSHPCRYKYVLEEEKRPGEYFPVEEDARGTYIMNSKDLCMIRHIPDLANAGVMSLKIEGRIKSIFYLATTIHAYRQAIDAYEKDPENWTFDESWYQELLKASHREFTTGFFFDGTRPDMQNYETSAYIKEYSFIGKVLSYDASTGYAQVEQRNKMVSGDTIEVFGPDITYFQQQITSMQDWDSGEELEAAPHPKQMLRIHMEQPVKPGYLLRKR